MSFIDKSSSFEWIVESIDRSKVELFFILLNDKGSYLQKYLNEKGIKTYTINYSGKTDIIKSVLTTFRILKNERTDVVHCHLFDASLVGLLAAKLAGIKKRIHTRHNATIHHDYHPSAVKYDKFINYLSTNIIAISNNVKDILISMEGVNESKIVMIPHGFNWNEFDNTRQADIQLMREKYQIDGSAKPVIGVISRFIEWKGIQYIIPAFKNILKKYPSAHLILANASGPYKLQLIKLLKEIPETNYTLVPFENNVGALYKLFDVFVHVPVDSKCEAFGQTYIEAMYLGVPSVFTRSGIANEIIENNENSVIVNYRDSNAIYQGIERILTDSNLSEKLSSNSKLAVQEKFGLEGMIHKLELLYCK